MNSLKERLLDKTIVDVNGCWLFTGALNSRGYGCISVEGKVQLAHRVSYELHASPIDAGLTIDHLCRNKQCVNPDHLEPVTVGENNRRAPSSGYGKTHCLRGHEYTPENTHRNAKGTRSCKACTADRQRGRNNKNSGKTSSAYFAARRAAQAEQSDADLLSAEQDHYIELCFQAVES